MKEQFIQTGETGIHKHRKAGHPKKAGQYMCRMLLKRGVYHYDFVSYYPKRGWLTHWTVTDWIDIENPEQLDQDPE